MQGIVKQAHLAASETAVENEGVREDKWKIIYLYQMQTADTVSALIADSSKKLGCLKRKV